jgi:hypothetical protein
VASSSGVVPHVGGGIIGASRRGWRPSVSLTGTYLVPFETVSDGVKASTSIVSVRAVASVEFFRVSTFAVDAGIGGGIDVVDVTGRAEKSDGPADGITYPPSARVDGIVTGLLTGYAGLAPGVALTIIGGVEWDVNPPVYVTQIRQESEFLKPWNVRPLVMAGFTFTALGSGLFAGRAR